MWWAQTDLYAVRLICWLLLVPSFATVHRWRSYDESANLFGVKCGGERAPPQLVVGRLSVHPPQLVHLTSTPPAAISQVWALVTKTKGT